jgi:hypothetical protein
MKKQHYSPGYREKDTSMKLEKKGAGPARVMLSSHHLVTSTRNGISHKATEKSRKRLRV